MSGAWKLKSVAIQVYEMSLTVVNNPDKYTVDGTMQNRQVSCSIPAQTYVV